MSKSKILFQVSGSIAAFKAASVVSRLVKDGHRVKVVFSQNADRFIGKSTFEGLTGHSVFQEVFDPHDPMAHIDLARWADVMVLCPASANSLAQLAYGFAQDLIGTLFLARSPKVPYLIFPAMNQQMWAAPTVKDNCARLSQMNQVHIIKPNSGLMACGETGEGRLPEPEEILKVIARFLTPSQSFHPKRGSVLITGGGTSEPIDSVRFITNFSTGSTAVGLSEYLQKKGFDVKLLLSRTALSQAQGVESERFTTHRDLEQLLRRELQTKHYQAVIHLAAVSDFTVPESAPGKISSKTKELSLKLVPTTKLISHLREWSANKDAKIIGFKLTSGSEPSERLNKAKDLLETNHLDGVVSNDLSEIGEEHQGVFLKTHEEKVPFNTKTEMYQILETFLKENL